ncbi:MAG: ATP-binding protein [Opitutaceae bacterium]|nr:ATP-binding protein [Cytophagales bacterium]
MKVLPNFTQTVEGTRIGMYIVKRIVEQTGGRIEIKSKIGTGTTFLVYIPELATT